MATLVLRTFAFLAIAFAAIVATCYALLVIWDRTHLPQLPPEMRAEVWNGGHHKARPADDTPAARLARQRS